MASLLDHPVFYTTTFTCTHCREKPTGSRLRISRPLLAYIIAGCRPNEKERLNGMFHVEHLFWIFPHVTKNRPTVNILLVFYSQRQIRVPAPLKCVAEKCLEIVIYYCYQNDFSSLIPVGLLTFFHVFTTRAYARAVLGVVILSVRLYVCLSVCPSVCHTRGLWQN